MSATIDWEPGDALIFATVVDQRSFTRAAHELDLPKSTVSRRVTRLEESLGVQLLRRTTRRLDLTDAGRAFHLRASEAVEALVAAEQAATAALDEPVGRLRVSAPVELGTRMFRALLGFAEEYPEVHLDLELSNRFVDLLEEGFDVALRGGRPPEGALSGRSLGTGELHVVASPDYLERRGKPKSARDVSKHDCVLFPTFVSNSCWTLSGDRGPVSIPVHGRMTINNLEGVRLAALGGYGLTLLPDSYCDDDVESGRLVRVLPRLRVESAGLWVVYSRVRFMTAKVRAFADFMQRELRT